MVTGSREQIQDEEVRDNVESWGLNPGRLDAEADEANGRFR